MKVSGDLIHRLHALKGEHRLVQAHPVTAASIRATLEQYENQFWTATFEVIDNETLPFGKFVSIPSSRPAGCEVRSYTTDRTNCPFCQREMLVGTICSHGFAEWQRGLVIEPVRKW